MDPVITEKELTQSIKNRIHAGFAMDAIEKTGIDGLKETPIVFELSNDDIFIGVVAVQMFWGNLHIKYLFIQPEFRARKMGSKLLAHALAYGKFKRCRFAFVETMNFQAPGFYQKFGFRIELIREGYECNTSFIYLKKDL